jgi:putative transcriptional regulator
MAQVLRNKNLATRFQILVEIAANQPYIQQKDIAGRIGVTSQAVSDYISKLEKDGWISSDGRSRYRVTREGVNWVLKALRELQQYSSAAEGTLTSITTWAAIAERDFKNGETVGLVMKHGLLYAARYDGKGAHGITTSGTRTGEDVGITDIDGIVPLEPGRVTVMEVPDIQDGGSRGVDYARLKRQLARAKKVGAIGIEAIVALRRAGREPDCLYGVTRAAIEAARSGLTFVIACAGGEEPQLLRSLADENVRYRLVDLAKTGSTASSRKNAP